MGPVYVSAQIDGTHARLRYGWLVFGGGRVNGNTVLRRLTSPRLTKEIFTIQLEVDGESAGHRVRVRVHACMYCEENTSFANAGENKSFLGLGISNINDNKQHMLAPLTRCRMICPESPQSEPPRVQVHTEWTGAWCDIVNS